MGINNFNVLINTDENLKKIWESEEVPQVKFLTIDEQYCKNLYVGTHRRNEESRYV